MHEELSHRRAGWILIGVLLAGAILYLVPVWWGLPSYTGWAADEAIPSRVLAPKTWSAKYPPLHRYLLRGLYGLFDSGSPWTGLQRYTALFVLGRLVSVAMALATVFLVYRCGRQLGDRRASLLGAAAFAAIPSLVYYSKTANLEVPYLFWFSASLLFFLKILRKQRLRDYLLFGIAAALAVCTKDQAFALYLATPPILVGALAARAEGPSFGARLGRALGDRRLWLGGLASAVVFGLVRNVLFDPTAFFGRLEFIMGAPASYRLFSPTIAGQLELAALSVRQLVFLLGSLVSAAALAGLWSALRHPREHWQLLTLVPMGLGYYLGFVAPIGYNYPRFLLPVALLAAPFCGLGLGRLWTIRRGPKWVPAAIAVLVLGAGLARAASVDLLLLRDTRYAVESWLRSAGEGGRTNGYGVRNLLPRGLRILEWGQLVREPCRHLGETRPGHIVAAVGETLEELEERAVRRLESGQLGYDVALRQPRPAAAGLLDLHGVESNLDRVSPELIVWQRGERACLDDRTVLKELVAAAAGDRAGRPALAEAILGQDLDDRLLYDSADVVGTHLQYGRWTYGVEPAGVAVRNRTAGPLVPWLELGCLAPPEAFPVTVRLDDGVELAEYVFRKRGKIRVVAALLAPGEQRLLLVQADKAWRSAGEGRELGVSVLRVELRSPAEPPASALRR